MPALPHSASEGTPGATQLAPPEPAPPGATKLSVEWLLRRRNVPASAGGHCSLDEGRSGDADADGPEDEGTGAEPALEPRELGSMRTTLEPPYTSSERPEDIYNPLQTKSKIVVVCTLFLVENDLIGTS
jgi:hypothetical protein